MKFDKEIQFENNNIYGASFGGPLAIVKDQHKSKKLPLKPVIFICSSSGKLISKINVCIHFFLQI